MTEREMLELAAVAIGLENLYWGEVSTENMLDHVVITTHDDGRVSTHKWNPLDNDGDAFRLAVALGMEVYIDTHPKGCSCTEAFSVTHKEIGERIIVNHDGDPAKATRLAITRAAAEIGRSMSNE